MIRLALVLTLLPAVASAECLGRAALDHGIVVRFDDGSSLTVTRRAGDLLDVVQRKTDGGPSSDGTRTAWFGIYQTERNGLSPDGTPFHAEARFDPVPTVPATSDGYRGTMIPVGDGSIGTLAVLTDVTDGDTLGAGPCVYKTADVALTYTLDGGSTISDRYIYLPDLGFAVPVDGRVVSALDPLP